MNKITTHDNLLVKFLYKEATTDEISTFSTAMLIHSDVYESYMYASLVQKSIHALHLCPSSQVEKNILAYC